jgi:ATP-dependent Clp protease adaptor protein ClpS
MASHSRPVPQKIEKGQEQTEEGPLYRVIIHNDNVTPMDFVIDILISIFLLPTANAAYVMYSAHLNGNAYVQTLPKPEAERRTNKAHFAARLMRYPLKFTIEPE